ncbi:hypothetical protein ACJ5NV_08065 [Loktanella agnita]|uniref:hypothetical protein n=1 Tax=Loktanella agnita TaxID=287097 RepID=UPI0039862223
MPFDWPTAEQMIYRVVRLRRLVLCALTIPFCLMLLGTLLDPVFLSPPRAVLAAVAVAALVTGHAVLFPNAPVETISLSVAVSGLALVAPLVRALTAMAPPGHAASVLIILVVVALLIAVVLTALVQSALAALVYAGPTVHREVKARIDLPCSVAVARAQYALCPSMRRGRIITGPADESGFFGVAILSPQVADPEDPTRPLIVQVAAKVLDESENSHQVMLALSDSTVTVTSETFVPTPTGCRVEISELPGDFTLGMHVLFWLTDQQVDNLIETADVITGEPVRVNGLAHGLSFLAVAAAVLSPRHPITDRPE